MKKGKNMNELYISNSMIYFKTKSDTCEKAIDEFLKKCEDVGIDITIEDSCLRDENGIDID